MRKQPKKRTTHLMVVEWSKLLISKLKVVPELHRVGEQSCK
ncbi:MAG: hypothetical protein ACQEWF_18370 [Bacillota bacterium]